MSLGYRPSKAERDRRRWQQQRDAAAREHRDQLAANAAAERAQRDLQRRCEQIIADAKREAAAALTDDKKRMDRFRADTLEEFQKWAEGEIVDQEMIAWAADGRDWETEANERYRDALEHLCDEDWLLDTLSTAGVKFVEADTREIAGAVRSIRHKVTVDRVPPIIAVDIDGSGLQVTFAHVPQIGVDVWRKCLPTLRAILKDAGFPIGELTVSETSTGAVMLSFNDRDPLAEPLEQKIHPYDPERGRSYLGRAADGSDLFLTLKNNSCVIVGGMQGGGKTAALLPVLAGMAGRVELHILDGGASGEWDVLRPICSSYDDSGEIDACGQLMGHLLDTRSDRMQRVTEAGRGAINFWDVPVAQREAAGLKPVVVVLEEAPQYMSKSQDTSDEKKIAEANRGRVGKAVKLLRKAGVTIFIVAQKPTDDEVPTTARDMGSQRLCFRLDSDVAAATVLGDSAYVEPKPTSIPAGKPGRFVARLDARGNVLGQAVYVPIAAIAEAVKHAPRPAQQTWIRAETMDPEPPPEKPVEDPPAPEPSPSRPTPPTPEPPTETTAESADPVRDWAIQNGLIPDDHPDHPGAKRPADEEEDEW